MSVKQDALIQAIAGKATERGFDKGWEVTTEDSQVIIHYGPYEDKASDHLHKQVIRNLVSRLMPTAESHLFSLDADNGQPTGFKVTIEVPESKPETPETSLAPDWVAGLTAEERLAMIRQLVA